jgi:hypothetical protein
MQRSTVIVPDPVTKTSHVCEGVALEQLVPNTDLSSRGESIEIVFGVDETLTLAGNDLDLQTQVIVVDMVDGNRSRELRPITL